MFSVTSNILHGGIQIICTDTLKYSLYFTCLILDSIWVEISNSFMMYFLPHTIPAILFHQISFSENVYYIFIPDREYYKLFLFSDTDVFSTFLHRYSLFSLEYFFDIVFLSITLYWMYRLIFLLAISKNKQFLSSETLQCCELSQFCLYLFFLLLRLSYHKLLHFH